MNILAIIPARKGSRGIPGKNMTMCAGKPLLQWTIEAAKKSHAITDIIVSSDGEDILSLAREQEVGVRRRPDEIATNEAPTEPVIDDVLTHASCTYDIIVLLQPTSPVRTGRQIDKAVDYMLSGYDSVLSVTPWRGFIWVDQMEPDRARIQRPFPPPAWGARPRRQDFLPTFKENGSIYVTTMKQWLTTHNRIGGRVGLYEMPEECGIEVDTPLDLFLVEHILEAAWKDTSR